MRADSFFEHESDSEFNSTKDLVDLGSFVSLLSVKFGFDARCFAPQLQGCLLDGLV